MTSPTSTAVPAAGRTVDDAARLRAYGLGGAGASLVGAVCAPAIIAWAPMVPESRFSYPFDSPWYIATQSFFALQHLAMLPLFLGLLLLERRRPSRALRIGTWISLAGQIVLAGTELVALTATDALVTDTTSDVVGSLYGVPMLLLGVGLLVAGIGAIRAGVFDGAVGWLVLALGVYVFVALIPAVFGPLVAGRIAIGVWLLGFAALGLAQAREARP
jgi:MFS family permease